MSTTIGSLTFVKNLGLNGETKWAMIILYCTFQENIVRLPAFVAHRAAV